MVKAAEMYRDFLEKNPDEKEEMDIWENAPLEKSGCISVIDNI